MSIAKMSHRHSACLAVCVAILLAAGAAHAQDAEQAPAAPGTLPVGAVPRLVKFSGTLKDGAGRPRSGTVSVAFAVYAAEEDGTPLWLETQNVQPDAQGRFAVLLGAASADGLPLELFSSGEPRWLGVRPHADSEAEQPRVLLVSVPYALKAAEAETLGGRPASAFVLAQTGTNPAGTSTTGMIAALGITPAATLSGSGTPNQVAKFTTNGSTLGNSAITSEANGNVGIGTTTPGATLEIVGGSLAPAPPSPLLGSLGGTSNPAASEILSVRNNAGTEVLGAYANGLVESVTTAQQTFNNDSTTGTVLNELATFTSRGTMSVTSAGSSGGAFGIAVAGAGTSPPSPGSPTQVVVAFSGLAACVFDNTAVEADYVQISATAAGQCHDAGPTYPTSGQVLGNVQNATATPPVVRLFQTEVRGGGGGGTVTSVGSGLGLTGGPITSTGTLAIDPTVVPQLGAASNTFTGGITASSFSGSGAGLSNVNALTLGGNLASAFATTGANSFLGDQTFTGNVHITGVGNNLTVGGAFLVNADTPGGAAITANCLASAIASCNGIQFNGMTGNNILNAQINGTQELNVDGSGNMTLNGYLSAAGATMPPLGTATAATGFDSNAFNLSASAFNGTTAQNQQFAWQAFPAANNTAGTSGELHLLFGAGGAAPADTGFFFDHTGKATFAPGQTFPGGAGGGTVTSIAQALGIIATPNPITGAGTIAIDNLVVPQLGVALNTFTGNISAATFTSTLAGGANAFAGPIVVTGNITATQNIGAASFTGNGPGLNTFATGITAPLYTQLGAAANNSFAGNITAGGIVTAAKLIGEMADLSLIQLPNTTNALTGVIEVGSASSGYMQFLHNYGGNTFLGLGAGNFTLFGAGNTASGAAALSALTVGSSNTAAGASALAANTEGNNNTATGYQALATNSSGLDNTATGYQAMQSNGIGSFNTATGYLALQANSEGYFNTATGAYALQMNTASEETATGFHALNANTTGSNNTADGEYALDLNTTGSYNTATGSSALRANVTGNHNSAFGYEALQSTTQNDNTAHGYAALSGNSTGVQNTAVGSGALTVNTTGGNNTAVGYLAGAEGGAAPSGAANTTGSLNTFIGAFSGPQLGSLQLTNATAIGANATVSCNNCLVLGNSSDASNPVFVGIGTSMPGAPLEVDGATQLDNNLTVKGNAIIQGTLSVVESVTGGLVVDSLGVSKNAIFDGDLSVAGNLTKGSGMFKIDHPLDPEHKNLYHSFVESPDMKNVYDGVVTLDPNGQAWVELPAYFEALNKDFRYQLTAIGVPAPSLYIAQEVHGNRFQIAGGKPGGKVSWQVTGVRQDAYAEKHPMQVEEEKPAAEVGFYLHPEAYGQPEEKGVAWARAHQPSPKLNGPRKEREASATGPKQ